MKCLSCEIEMTGRKRRFCSKRCNDAYYHRHSRDMVAKRESHKRYIEANREKVAESNRVRSLKRYYNVLRIDPQEQERQRQKAKLRKKKLRSLPKDFTSADWQAALEYFEHKCAYCGKPASKFDQDHFVPVRFGGGFTKNNIVPACPTCNNKKRAKNPIQWLISLPNALITYARIVTYLGITQ